MRRLAVDALWRSIRRAAGLKWWIFTWWQRENKQVQMITSPIKADWKERLKSGPAALVIGNFLRSLFSSPDLHLSAADQIAKLTAHGLYLVCYCNSVKQSSSETKNKLNVSLSMLWMLFNTISLGQTKQIICNLSTDCCEVLHRVWRLYTLCSFTMLSSCFLNWLITFSS